MENNQVDDNNQGSDEAFYRQSRQLLNDDIKSIDSATLSRLHRARNHALKTKQTYKPKLQWLASGALVVSIYFIGSIFYQPNVELPTIYEDPNQQAAAENIELLNDLEFVAWLILEEEGEAIESNNKATRT